MYGDHDNNIRRVPSWERLAASGNFEAIPRPFRWDDSVGFAHLLNGYTVMDPDKLGEFANERLREATRSGAWHGDPRELWLCLFYEHRRWRHFGILPEGDDKTVLDGLCETLRLKLLELSVEGRSQMTALMASHPFPGTREQIDGH